MPVQAELVQFEPNTGCNLRCPICPATATGYHHRVREVDPAIYRQVIERSFSPPYLLILSGFSEVLLHTRIEQIVWYEKSRGCRVMLATNGLLLEGERVQKLLDCGVDHFTVSVDSISPDVFLKVRGTRRLEKLLRNIEKLAGRI